MGLLIRNSFETNEGIQVSEVYCRIVRFIYDIEAGYYTISLKNEFYISREKRLSGYRPLLVPKIPDVYVFRGIIGDMTYLYEQLKTHITELGIEVEDVFETPPPPSQDSAPASE